MLRRGGRHPNLALQLWCRAKPCPELSLYSGGRGSRGDSSNKSRGERPVEGETYPQRPIISIATGPIFFFQVVVCSWVRSWGQRIFPPLVVMEC